MEKELERILQGGGVRDMEVEEVLEDEEEEGEGADGKFPRAGGSSQILHDIGSRRSQSLP